MVNETRNMLTVAKTVSAMTLHHIDSSLISLDQLIDENEVLDQVKYFKISNFIFIWSP